MGKPKTEYPGFRDPSMLESLYQSKRGSNDSHRAKAQQHPHAWKPASPLGIRSTYPMEQVTEIDRCITTDRLYFDFSSCFKVSPERPPKSCCTRVSHAVSHISKRARVLGLQSPSSSP